MEKNSRNAETSRNSKEAEGLVLSVFFSDNGTFDYESGTNIGSSTAYVYLEDGSIVTFDACTNPSAINYPVIPEKLIEATYGKHNGNYDALRMHDLGNSKS